MKIMIIILGVLIVLAGILPFLRSMGILPEAIPTAGVNYSILITVVGIIGLVYGLINKMIMGGERIVVIIIAALTILGGILPFIASVIPNSIPTSGPFYSLIIIVIGAVGIAYGVMALG